MPRCNFCKQFLDYCCETTILENRAKYRIRKPRLSGAEIYLVHRRKYGFDMAKQQGQLDKQHYTCFVCGNGHQPLVIDKQQAVDNKRLRLVCHSCLSILSKIRKYEQGKNIYKNL